MPPRLSIVIPSHSRADLLRLCLASIVRHAPPDIEVVVVDDGSPAGQVSRTAADFPSARVLRLARPAGFCTAVNHGIRAARAPVVQVLNDDTEVSAGWVEAALRHFEGPTIGAVAPLVLHGPPTDEVPRVDSAGDRYYLGGVAGKRGHGRPLCAELLQPGPVFGASASAAFYRRDAFLSVGGFAEDFGAYFEDVDLSFRLHWAGWGVYYEPACRVWHRVSASHGEPAGKLLSQQARNEERVFWRNLPRAALPAAVPRHLAVLAGKAWRRWRAGQLLPFLAGRLAVLAEVPQLLQQRRQVQAGTGRPDFASWQVEPVFWGQGPVIRVDPARQTGPARTA